MLEAALQSVFYDRILPNSLAAAGSIVIILAFRQFTKRWSKGYVRVLWILLLVQLLAPPLFQGSFYTVRDFGTGILGTGGEQQQLGADGSEQLENGQNNNTGKPGVSGNASKLSDSQTLLSENTGQQANGQVLLPGNTGQQTALSGNVSRIINERAPNSQVYVTGKNRSAVLSWAGVWAVRLWAAGILVWTAYYICLFLRLKIGLRNAFYINDQDYWVSGVTSVPFVMPGVPPKIYLPANMEPMQLENILAHERQHIRNWDPLLKCIAMFTLVVYWFHPLVWLAMSLFGKDMEMYCDECVLRGKSMAQRKAYSGTLLEFASKSSGLTLTMYFAKSNVERRIHHILNVKKPHRAVSLLLIAFICMSGVSFLSAKNVEGKAEASNQESLASAKDNSKASKQKSTGLPAYRKNARKFAKHVMKLVKSGKKKALAKMIVFPIRVRLNGEETNIVDAEEFVSHYSQIADKKWKASVLGTDVNEMFSNYMGYSLGDGSVWFSKQVDRKGYWIYAINNSGDGNLAVKSHTQNTQSTTRRSWEKLAASQGMADEEARKWYTRFVKDGHCENGLNFRFTGCKYGDFDGNGIKDIFVVSSLSPHEVYPETVTETMYIYGYMNEKWSYERGFQGFSQDGFQKFDVQDSRKPGISCTIEFVVDTDQLKEDCYLLEIGAGGPVVSQSCLTESEKVVQMLAQIPKEKYQSAISYEERQSMDGKDFGKGQVVLLQSMADAGIRVFGYDGEEYGGTRGVIVDYKGTYSYFDLMWNPVYYRPKLYQGDFDRDFSPEFALIYPYGHWTGIYWEGLYVFKVQQDNTLSCSPMIMDHQYFNSQIGPFIKYDKANGKINIVKNGKTKQVIDLTSSPEYAENKEKLMAVYTTDIRFDVNGNQIKMFTEVQGQLSETMLYLEGVENTAVEFQVLYSEDGFMFDLP